MQSNPTARAAETPDDLGRLRVFLAGRGAAPYELDRHLNAPRYRPTLTRIAERGGTIVGCALLGHRRLRLGAALLEAGAIQRFDAPDDDAGFAALLGDCLGALLGEGLPLALAVGADERYTLFGFAPYRHSATTELAIAGLAAQHNGLRPATADDLDDLAALYEANYRELPLADVRAASDWRAWLAAAPAALALEDGRSRVVAYAALTPTIEGGALWVAEACAADAGAARGLCATLAAQAREIGAQRIALMLSPAHLVARAALQLGGAALIRVTPVGDAALAGVVDLPTMLEALLPEIERRLDRSRYAGWSGNLRIEIATEQITLACDSGHATVTDGSRPADLRLRQVELSALAQLLLGYRSAADLRATGGLACDDTALGLIDVLFPVLPF